MHFNTHYDLEGQHAFLGPSKYHWVNYSEEKLEESYKRVLATQIGTELHQFASTCIRLNQKLPKTKKTINMYVNDAIGYKMRTEQILFYSYNAFGTADTICFRKNLLRISDLKTGVSPAYMKQLEIYTGLFCLEYRTNPGDIEIELRIYQNDEIEIYTPEVPEILRIMDRIKVFDERIEKLKLEMEE
jgi:hypothetical protein